MKINLKNGHKLEPIACPCCGNGVSPSALVCMTCGHPISAVNVTEKRLDDMARSTAETAKAVREIRNLYAAVMIFWLAVLTLGIIFGVIGPM
jgi:predicted amidophosphoribosyltransferase